MPSLADYDKQQISMIDEQVEALLAKGASDNSIFNTLIDFIPDVQCFIHSEDEITGEYIKTKPNFIYFASLIRSFIG